MCPAQAAARPGNDRHAPVKIDHLSLPSLLSFSSLQLPFLQFVLGDFARVSAATSEGLKGGCSQRNVALQGKASRGLSGFNFVGSSR